MEMKKQLVTKVIPEYQCRKILSRFGGVLIKSFIKQRDKEVNELLNVLREVARQKPTIH
jgi:hypothetical protein